MSDRFDKAAEALRQSEFALDLAQELRNAFAGGLLRAVEMISGTRDKQSLKAELEAEAFHVRLRPGEIPEGACCANEKRNMAGGCESCGAPCI